MMVAFLVPSFCVIRCVSTLYPPPLDRCRNLFIDFIGAFTLSWSCLASLVRSSGGTLSKFRLLPEYPNSWTIRSIFR